MILARSLKLEVNEQEHDILMQTLEQYKSCLNFTFENGFQNHTTSGSNLHNNTYSILRQRYPELPSALVCVARVKVTEALKAIKSRTKGKWNTKQPKSAKYPAIRYNKTCCAIGKDVFALTTVAGRIKLPIIKNPFFKEDIKQLQGSCELSYRASKKEWYLTVFVNIQEQEQRETKDILGIDRGCKHIAVCSNNVFFDSKHLRNIKGKYRYLRKKLQSKGTKSAKKLLKKLSRKENRFQKDVNHCISKKIVNSAFDTFVLEDLDIHAKKEKGKKFNTILSGWSWYQLEQFLKYKSKLVGKRVEFVDARYTSQKCSVCGHVERGNRKSQSQFCCKKCGFRLNADLNASRNIKQNYIASLSIPLSSRVSSITHTLRAIA